MRPLYWVEDEERRVKSLAKMLRKRLGNVKSFSLVSQAIAEVEMIRHPQGGHSS